MTPKVTISYTSMLNNAHTPYIFIAIGLLVLWGGYEVFRSSTSYHDVMVPAQYEEVHVHGDILFSIDGQRIDLAQEKYQSTTEDQKHPDIHLHDNEGNILHRHADGVTFGEFLSSIGYTLDDTCVVLDTGVRKCAEGTTILALYVNGIRQDDIASYEVQDEDQILFYYGEEDTSVIDDALNTISDRACIFSGTCPDRGTPPPESCGLTCTM